MDGFSCLAILHEFILPRLQMWHRHCWCSCIPRATCIPNFRKFYTSCLTQILLQSLERISVLTSNRVTQRVFPFPISNITVIDGRESATGLVACVFYDQSQLSPSMHSDVSTHNHALYRRNYW